MKRLVSFLLFVFFALPLMAQDDEGFAMSAYHNERFHYSLDYPSEFSIMAESEDGDGVTLASGEGNHIRIYGGFNAKTIFGTSFLDEYKAQKQQFLDRQGAITETDCIEQPYDGVDGFYVIIGMDHGLHYYRRTIWWDDKFATVEFTFYPENAGQYKEELADITIYSLMPGWSPAFGYEYEEVLQWYVDGTAFTVFDEIDKPNIGDLFNAFAIQYPTNLIMTAHEKILGVPDLYEDDIAEWVYDVQNGYLRIRMVSDFDKWVEACYWNMDNGHKLFVVNHNVPDQLIMAFDYDPVTRQALVAPDVFNMLNFHPEYVVRLPRKGKNVDLYESDNLSKAMNHLLWSGHDFKLEK
jgi:hypothetical protein